MTKDETSNEGGVPQADPRSDNLHFVTELENLQPGERILVDINEQEIGLFNVKGEIFAIANWCAHQGGPICEGPLTGTIGSDDSFELIYEGEDETLICPWHGWEFNVKTGNHLAPTKISLPTYDVVVDDGNIFLKL